MKYLLIITIDEHQDLGGGTEIYELDSPEAVENKTNEIVPKIEEDLPVRIQVFEINRKLLIAPKTVTTSYKLKL